MRQKLAASLASLGGPVVVVGLQGCDRQGDQQHGGDPPQGQAGPSDILHGELEQYGEVEEACGLEYELWKRVRGRRIGLGMPSLVESVYAQTLCRGTEASTIRPIIVLKEWGCLPDLVVPPW